MRIETERLILRHPEVRDAEAYVSIQNSTFVMRYNAMAPCTLERARQQFSKPCPDMLIVELKETGAIIGTVCIEDDSIRWDVNSRELSYFLAETYARKGYMKEALEAVICHLFERKNLECVTARCFAPNTASIALLKSLGFHQDGYIPYCVKGYGGEVFDDTLHSLFRKNFRAK